MLRIIVSVLVAFVGFSFGHSIPKWMESKSKSCIGAQSPSALHHHRPPKPSFRRKSLRKMKFGSQKSGKVSGEGHESLHKLCHGNDDDADIKGSNSVQSVPLYGHDRLAKEPKKLKFGCRRLQKDKSKTMGSHDVLDFAVDVPPCSATMLHPECKISEPDAHANPKHGCHQPQATSPDQKISRHELCQISSSQLNAMHVFQQEAQANEASQNDSESIACKSSSCGSPLKEKGQMKQWKMKLMSLRSKAMASEKVWYEKFDNETCGGKLLAVSGTGPTTAMKETSKGKENESPHEIRAKKRDFFWSRSSSKVGLLVESPTSAFER
ncbi:hypothetical protein GOP47_0027436 [Adiantum capillus-veneris]|nr:hypothetical protein GOP47_0027436 [Adiantum capillus-veneris]